MTNAKTENIQGKYGPFAALVISGDTLAIMNQLKIIQKVALKN